jgi:predicted transcriptional regulator
MVRKKARPTDLEFTILKALWTGGPSSVRELTATLNESRPTGYTTVLKICQIMHGKGLVDRDESQRPQIYRARYSQVETQRQLVRDLVERAFGGSTRSLVMQALSARKATPGDLEAMEKLLDSIEGGSK